jgi:hypothetical protein
MRANRNETARPTAIPAAASRQPQTVSHHQADHAARAGAQRLFGLVAQAQTGTSGIRGQALDPQAKGIPSARITGGTLRIYAI